MSIDHLPPTKWEQIGIQYININVNQSFTSYEMGADRNMTEASFDHHGGQISVSAYGFNLSIPPGAIEEGHPCTISIQVLTSTPEDLVLRDGEMLISLPFKCSPSNLSFKKPVKISMPHCAVFHNPDDEVKFVHYWRESEDEGKM